MAFSHLAQRFFPSVLWRGDSLLPQVALSFDDGPDPVNTPKILDILAELGVNASFFLQGKHVEEYPEIAARIAAEGHTVGNHTHNHLRLILKSKQTIYREIKTAEMVIAQATGIIPRKLRPPYGLIDWRGLSVAKEMGYQIVMWSAIPWDWKAKTSGEIVTATLASLANGVIVVLHDRTPELPEALKRVIQAGEKRGFRFVSLEQMICSPQQR